MRCNYGYASITKPFPLLQVDGKLGIHLLVDLGCVIKTVYLDGLTHDYVIKPHAKSVISRSADEILIEF